jgi:chromosomal replication initiation ATPase DnaA
MSTGKGRQLVLALPHRTALGRDDFLVSPANAAAVAMIDQWPDWPSHALLLVGPPGSGKSHLVEVWRQASGAARIAAGDLDEASVPALLAGGGLAIEDAPGDALDERALFHLLNLARQQGGRVLITAQQPPGRWGVALPDLLSRLRAAPVAELGAADDALLRGVLVKLFADRQLAVEETVISYLVVRMPRSLDAARHVVAEIDRRALEDKAQISRVLVARVLSELTEPGLFPED